jgi:hypothetical protein
MTETPPPPPPEDDWGSGNTPWQQPQQPPQQPPQQWPQQPPPGQWQQQPAPGQWQQPGGYGQPPPAQIQTYLIPAIVVTVLCCLPTGIAAIVYAAQASSKAKVGDMAGATKAANNARTWVIVSVVGGLLFAIILIASQSGA